MYSQYVDFQKSDLTTNHDYNFIYEQIIAHCLFLQTHLNVSVHFAFIVQVV